MRNKPYEPLLEPTSSAPLSDRDRNHILTLLYREHRVGPYNVAHSIETKNERGYPVSETVNAVNIGATPVEGVPAEHSLVNLPDAGEVHMHLAFDKGAVIGINDIRRLKRSEQRLHIVPMLEHAWAVDLSSDAPPTRVDRKIDPIFAHDHFGGQWNTQFLGARHFVVNAAIYGGHLSVNEVLGLNSPEMTTAIERANQAEERYQRLHNIAKKHFDQEVILKLINMGPAGDFMPDHDGEKRRDWDTLIDQTTFSMLRELRKNGLVASCPNNGPRQVHQLGGWDAWLNAEDTIPDVRKLPYEHQTIVWSPLFRIIQKAYVSEGIDIYPDRDTRKNNQFTSEECRVLDTTAMRRISERICRDVASDNVTMADSIDLTSKLDGSYLHLERSMLKPVLAQYDSAYRIKTVLDPIEIPVPLRHIVLPVPSGKLVSADWPRVPGFNEYIESLELEDFNISSKKGLTNEQEALFTKLGILKIQVGNTSPTAYKVSDGVWRAGDPDEDSFYDEDGNETSEHYEESWRTCTDLWANTYVDYDQLTSILMASGKYGQPAAAQEAIDQYVADHYGASIIEIGQDHLHFYVPNGETHVSQKVMEQLDLEEHGFDPDEEWYDYYFISETPLPIEKEFLAEHDWQPAGPIAAEARCEGPEP